MLILSVYVVGKRREGWGCLSVVVTHSGQCQRQNCWFESPLAVAFNSSRYIFKNDYFVFCTFTSTYTTYYLSLFGLSRIPQQKHIKQEVNIANILRNEN